MCAGWQSTCIAFKKGKVPIVPRTSGSSEYPPPPFAPALHPLEAGAHAIPLLLPQIPVRAIRHYRTWGTMCVRGEAPGASVFSGPERTSFFVFHFWHAFVYHFSLNKSFQIFGAQIVHYSKKRERIEYLPQPVQDLRYFYIMTARTTSYLCTTSSGAREDAAHSPTLTGSRNGNSVRSADMHMRLQRYRSILKSKTTARPSISSGRWSGTSTRIKRRISQKKKKKNSGAIMPQRCGENDRALHRKTPVLPGSYPAITPSKNKGRACFPFTDLRLPFGITLPFRCIKPGQVLSFPARAFIDRNTLRAMDPTMSREMPIMA